MSCRGCNEMVFIQFAPSSLLVHAQAPGLLFRHHHRLLFLLAVSDYRPTHPQLDWDHNPPHLSCHRPFQRLLHFHRRRHLHW